MFSNRTLDLFHAEHLSCSMEHTYPLLWRTLTLFYGEHLPSAMENTYPLLWRTLAGSITGLSLPYAAGSTSRTLSFDLPLSVVSLIAFSKLAFLIFSFIDHEEGEIFEVFDVSVALVFSFFITFTWPDLL